LGGFRFSENKFWEGFNLVKMGLREGVKVMKSTAFKDDIIIYVILKSRLCDSQFPLNSEEAKTLFVLFTCLQFRFFYEKFMNFIIQNKKHFYDLLA